MGYVVFLVFLVLLSLLVFLLLRSKFSKTSKIIMSACVVALAVLIGIYNLMQDKQTEDIGRLKKAFLRGEVLLCYDKVQEYAVNKDEFNLNAGINSVLGKPESAYNRLVLSLKNCKIKADSLESKD